ncbi:hypothetical protein M9H77_36037 [Catharanthus roseus]|uniref:Uncharacterized protein n=1 Tax=Catharanthus roseus TaxID=4058 RepID=A0ACB9ZQP8_CATRO|nr:hypothetical protein M9H77_36037 [Catharanthus roseus]
MSVMSKIAGSQQKRPEKSRPPTNPTQRKKSKNDGWEQTVPDDGGPQDPVIVPSYSGHVAGCIWRGQYRDILKSRSRYVSLTGWTPSDPAVSDLHISDSSIGINAQDLAGVTDSPHSRLSTEQRAACYVLYLLGSSLFTDKSGNNASRADAKELSGCWSLLEALWPEAPSHLLTSTWTSIPAIPPSRCTDDYMPWFLPRTHPRIQNPYRLPRSVQMPTIAPITPQVLLDMVARELDRDDIDDATKVSRASDMIKRYHQTRR